MSDPEKFGKYTILRRLAVGGTAEISLARYDGIGGFEKTLVLKRLLPSLCEDRSQVTQFLNEARIGACLAHPNVVQTHEVGEVSGRYFIAMEYVPGADLERVMRILGAAGKRLPLEIALRVVSEVCAGLHFAHSRADAAGQALHIVHRDVTPANILISNDGSVKLTDFGVAKVLDSRSMARSGVFRGKFAYMSPEQCAGERLDARSDIFSLGIVLYEITLGRRPFQGENQFQILREISEGVSTPPRVIDPRYPVELEAIVLRALAHDREDRYPSALEMQADLEQFAAWRGFRASSVQVAEFMQGVLSLNEPEIDPGAALEELGAQARSAAAEGAAREALDELAEWVAEETTTSRTRELGEGPFTPEKISKVYREGCEAFQRQDYRRSIDTFRVVLHRSPRHELARKGLYRAVVSALRESPDEEFRDVLGRAADLFDLERFEECKDLVDDVIGETPLSSPQSGLLRRISAVVSERIAQRDAGMFPG